MPHAELQPAGRLPDAAPIPQMEGILLWKQAMHSNLDPGSIDKLSNIHSPQVLPHNQVALFSCAVCLLNIAASNNVGLYNGRESNYDDKPFDHGYSDWIKSLRVNNTIDYPASYNVGYDHGYLDAYDDSYDDLGANAYQSEEDTTDEGYDSPALSLNQDDTQVEQYLGVGGGDRWGTEAAGLTIIGPGVPG
ncbi:uncharacterized protein EV420DRAFT_1652801 [Desarmillaria tabescens]|uniref:Uncharacterized protein n=1 Tax=Armillaria tabescens TaxID=1929756 RepID=A0AA39J807_ARMTA|nr:uncharacterized protein EV420DRAFT_1652801 [Desarmillaria tabescens]KAK0435943.1 hypothetical protein EV420DRAFT_1652801 [Desarmillaria tabescens]